MTNTYTVETSETGFSGGRYKSKSPAGAAKKAASRIFKSTNKKTITLTIRETTQGSNKKLHKYEAKHIKLTKPIIIKIKGVEIKYEYKTEVKALEISGGGDDEFLTLRPSHLSKGGNNKYNLTQQPPLVKGGGDTCDGTTCSF